MNGGDDHPMPARRPHERHLFLGLCASLLVHGAIVSLGLDAYERQLEGRIYQPGYGTVPIVTVAAPLPSEFILGDASGTGTAIEASDWPEPLQAAQASQDQPLASLDPAGQHGAQPPTAAMTATDVPVDASKAQAVARFGVAPEAVDAVPQALGNKHPQPRRATDAPAESKPTEAPVAPTPPREAAVASSQEPSPAPGDPGPATETEIDPFSRTASAEFHFGRTDVQFGRRSKLRRPDILLAGQMDLIGAAIPRVTLGIRTDATGKVIDAQVLRSSGSKNIDQPVRLAAYDWWFEPPLGPDGKPVPDSFAFTVTFQ
jgi:TonB family protein